MGPEDSYLLQYTNDVNTFWAEGGALELGATFQAKGTPPKTRVPKVCRSGAWRETHSAAILLFSWGADEGLSCC